MNRFFPRALAWLLLASASLLPAGRLAAQNDSSDSFCILPIYDPLTGGISDAALQAEMDKLKAQVGPPRRYFKIGFSHLFGGPGSGGNSARMAKANGLSVGFIVALQTHDANSTTLNVANQDLRLYQWRLDGKTWKGKNTGTSTNPAYPSRDICVTPSRYATALQNSYKSQATTTAGQIKTVMSNYPGTVVVVNAAIEEELATGDGTDTYLANGAHVLFPGWWENTNSSTFLLTDSNFALGLHDWLAAQADLPVPGGQGLAARYYNNTGLTGTPALTRVDPAINFVWTGTSPDPAVNATNFSANWSGWIKANYTETYTFYTDTDDGVRLYVNNTAVINQFSSQSLKELSGTISLVAGQYYPITMQYFQGTGAAQAQLSWSSASQAREIILPNVLSHNSGGALRFNVNSANITWPGSVSFADDTQVTFFSAGGSYQFTSPMSGSGNVQFHAGGAANNHFHTVILTAAGTYAGNTTAFGDAANITLQLSGVPDGLPTSTVLTLAGDYFQSTALRGWLDLNGNNQTLAGLTTTVGARGTGDNRVVNSASATAATLTINNVDDYIFAGVLGGGTTSNNLNLSKTGAGTFALTGTNTYTGYTRVLGGTLTLSATGSLASPLIDVETGATPNVGAVTGGFALGASQTLSGVGTIAGAATIAGVHQPGVGGTQTFANGVTFAATAREVWQLLANTTSGAATNFDQVAAMGTATIKSGAVMNINLATANLIKYALGLDPAASTVTGLPVAARNGGRLQLQFARNPAATDVILQVLASNDLTTWSAVATLPAGATTWMTAQGTTVTENSGQVTILDGVTTPSGARRFLRLQVTQAP